MIKLEDFKNSFQDAARPNRFLVEVSPPKAYQHSMGSGISLLTFLAQGAKIPEKNIGEVEIKYFGMQLKLPGDSTHDDLSLTFINDYDWKARQFFEDWVNFLQTISGDNKRADAYDAIWDATVLVTQLGRTEEDKLSSYKFFNCFPKNVAEIELNMETNDQIENFQVTFSYSHSTRETP